MAKLKYILSILLFLCLTLSAMATDNPALIHSTGSNTLRVLDRNLGLQMKFFVVPIDSGDTMYLHLRILSLEDSLRRAFRVIDTLKAVIDSGSGGGTPYDSAGVAGTADSAATSGDKSILGIWNRQGVVIYPDPTLNNPRLIGEPTLIQPEGNPQLFILDTTISAVWKMWYTNAGYTSIRYAESVDGIEWVSYADTVILNHQRPFVIKHDSVYYLYAALFGGDGKQIDAYSSTDGLNFTLLRANVITPSLTDWDYDGLHANSSGVVIDDTLYLFVESTGEGSGGYQIGLYSSTDFQNFTGRGLVIERRTYPGGASSPSTPHFVNGRWWMWIHSTQESYIYRYSAPAITGPWTTVGNVDFDKQTWDEGASSGWGQVADPDVLEFDGKTYLYYTATHGDTSYASSTIKLAIADMPLSEVVKRNGGVNAGSLGIKGNLGLKYSFFDNRIDFGRRAIKNLGGIYPLSPDGVGINTLTIHGSLIIDEAFAIGAGYNFNIGVNSMIGIYGYESPMFQFGTGGIYLKGAYPLGGTILAGITNSGFRWREDYTAASQPIDVPRAKIDSLVGQTSADSLLTHVLGLGRAGVKIDSSFTNGDSVFARIDGIIRWIGRPRP